MFDNIHACVDLPVVKLKHERTEVKSSDVR
jgi:hypothetical protein